MATIAPQLSNKGLFPRRGQILSRNDNSSRPLNTYYPRPISPVYNSPKPASLEFQKTTLNSLRSTELSKRSPPAPQVIVNLGLDRYGDSSFRDYLLSDIPLNEMTELYQFDRAAPAPSPLMLDCQSLDPELSPSFSSGSNSPIPRLDISDDGYTTDEDPTQNQQTPNLSVRNRGPRNLLASNATASSAPRGFYPDRGTYPSANTVPPLDPPLSPNPTSSQPFLSRSVSQEGLVHNDGEEPWERLRTLASLAVADAMAMEGDEEIGQALDIAQLSDIRSTEFLGAINYLSRVDYNQARPLRRRWQYLSDENSDMMSDTTSEGY
ncbi:hypothetical protein TWF506_005355 [Arthrobotrys conoides]|uniref:Uncharacterized protein n=1 Tax=Arthrobotrys conoides TaxID=74498 RepID=A0AAN8NJH6_9PEZI